MLTSEIKAELSAWMRSVSPMTAYLQSCRMEEKGASAAAQASGKQPDDSPTDPYAGIDLDELPDNVRAAIQKSRGEFTTLQTQVKEAATKADKAEHFARNVQSRADKLERVVKTHNLPVDGNPTAPSDPQAVLEADFIKNGLKPEAATVYAKMFVDSEKRVESRILGQLGPLAASVGDLRADSLLANAQGSKPQVFAIPEVAKSVRENLSVLVQQGAAISDATIEHLTQMAYGAYAMNNPVKPAAPMQQVLPSFGNTMQSGVLPNHTQPPANGAPQATQAETVAIMNQIGVHLRHGLPPKK